MKSIVSPRWRLYRSLSGSSRLARRLPRPGTPRWPCPPHRLGHAAGHRSVELSLDQIPLTPNSADAVRSLDATATVNLEEGGWAAVIFRNPDGVPVAGYVLIADDYLVSDPTPVITQIPVERSARARPSDLGRYRSGNLPERRVHLRRDHGNHSTEFGLTIERGPSLNVAKIGPVPEPMVIFIPRRGVRRNGCLLGRGPLPTCRSPRYVCRRFQRCSDRWHQSDQPAVSYMP